MKSIQANKNSSKIITKISTKTLPWGFQNQTTLKKTIKSINSKTILTLKHLKYSQFYNITSLYKHHPNFFPKPNYSSLSPIWVWLHQFKRRRIF